MDAFLTPCLTYASSQVPSASHLTTPIYFGGTAGLRLLKYKSLFSPIMLFFFINLVSLFLFYFYSVSANQVQLLFYSTRFAIDWVDQAFDSSLRTLKYWQEWKKLTSVGLPSILNWEMLDLIIEGCTWGRILKVRTSVSLWNRECDFNRYWFDIQRRLVHWI